jgi:hypothetical protein
MTDGFVMPMIKEFVMHACSGTGRPRLSQFLSSIERAGLGAWGFCNIEYKKKMEMCVM